MKGLLFSCSDRKAEGYELAKRGVRMDMQSHIVWHVYGIMYRADKNYEEALKCYNQAHKIDKVRHFVSDSSSWNFFSLPEESES